MKKRAQQEIAGFVIIVVLVVVAALIFLVISVNRTEMRTDSMQVSMLLDSLMDHTTECVVRAPLPLSVGALIREAYGTNPVCQNIDASARDHLTETIESLMENIMRLETRFDAYELHIYQGTIEDAKIDQFLKGTCTGTETIGAVRSTGDFSVWLGICLNSNN